MTKIEQYKSDFDENGFVIVRNFLKSDVAYRLKAIAEADVVLNDNTHAVLDSEGRQSKLTLWYTPGDDVFGRLSRSSLMYDYMQNFLGGPISFFHAKLMNKEAEVGGKWEWHQDYGYWHEDGFPRADMGSCFIALDPCREENGALRVIPKSHKYGRMAHGVTGQQSGADMMKVDKLANKYRVTICDMEPGDALFFHANLLHASGANLSKSSRLIMISSFFRKDNESVQNDRRYKNKDIAIINHDDVMNAQQGLDPHIEFSKADDHIIMD